MASGTPSDQGIPSYKTQTESLTRCTRYKMRFSLVTSVSILALPFTLAIPIGLLDNVKSGELVTFRKLSPFQSCGIVGPCFCDSTGCFQAISPAKTPGGDIMKVGKQDEVPVAPDDQISSTQQASPTTSAVDIRRR